MTWKRHFKLVTVNNSGPKQPSYSVNSDPNSNHNSNYSSYLPEVYAGHPNRIQRYQQYDEMDRDSEVNGALNIIADFCTQSEEQNEMPFEIKYSDGVNETEIKLISSYLQKWVKINNFRSRLWYIFRGVIKNGDQFFVRDPETNELLWVDHFNVELVKVDETQGREPTEYVIRNLDYNKTAKLATKPARTDGIGGGLSRGTVGTHGGSNFQLPGTGLEGRNNTVSNSQAVDAKHVVHLSLSVGMDINWPFGASVLEAVFKSYKQKELLEDAVIIYRVQRAPERRIFKIDVGNMNPVMANAYVERIKNEIHQRRIPNRNGGGSSTVDAAYSPLSMLEDFFFAQSTDGRGSSVETLAGGDQTGEIGDLEYFNKKLRSGLGVPNAYMPGSDDQANYSDGKLGSAMIQEYRFNKYCMRLQSLLAPSFDSEFKLFLKNNGISIEDNLFDLQFCSPQNFTKYRQIELDSQQMNVYSQIAENKRLSERFKLERYLNLSPEELVRNQQLWAEENPHKVKAATGGTVMHGGGSGGSSSGLDGLGAVGVSPDDGDLSDTESGDSGDLGADADSPATNNEQPPSGDTDTGDNDETI